MNTDLFFSEIDKHLFSGTLFQSQKDGMIDILQEWYNYGLTDQRQLAYVLATVYHETGQKMRPVQEAGYLSKEKQMAYLQKQKYYPYFGQDLVHTTWKANYQKVKDFTGVDVVNQPHLIGQMPLAAKVAIHFMNKGYYTGKKLSDYFNSKKEDWINARKVINGTDKASMIAEYAKEFYNALKITVTN